MNLKRAIAFYLVLVVAALGLSFAGTVARATAASACSWSVEHVNTNYLAFDDGGGTDYLYNSLTTYAGGVGVGCNGYKYYTVHQWTAYDTAGNYHTAVRVWICGTYYGQTVSGSATVSSPAFHYVGCSRQADNSGSWFYDPANAKYYSVYVTQG